MTRFKKSTALCSASTSTTSTSTSNSSSNEILSEPLAQEIMSNPVDTNSTISTISTNSIFNKLKRKTENIQSGNDLHVPNTNTIQDEIVKLREEQQIIKQTCLQILELLQNKDRI